MHVRKFILCIATLSTLVFTGGALMVSAQDNSFVGPPAPTTQTNALEIKYKPLAPLPLTGGAPVTEYTLSTYLSGMLKLIIALGAAFAVLMGVVGGIQYVASGITPSKKKEANDRILNAVTGLILVLTSYLILNTINPELVNLNLSLPAVKGTSATAAPTVTAPGGPSMVVPTDGSWPSDEYWRTDLKNTSILVNKPNCTVQSTTAAGGSNCTSVYMLKYYAVNKLKNLVHDCCTAAGIMITGGTEYWLHQTHNSWDIVDLSQTPEVSNYIKGAGGVNLASITGCGLPSAPHYKVSGSSTIYVDEPNTNGTGHHWHVCFFND